MDSLRNQTPVRGSTARRHSLSKEFIYLVAAYSDNFRGFRSKTKDNYLKMAAENFEVGDLVWAKMKNFPFWPAKIVNPPTEEENTAKGLQKKKPSTPRKAQHYVFFFGSQNHAWILDENIVPHSEEMLSKVTKKKSTSYVKAIDEIVKASGSVVSKSIPVKEDSVEEDKTSKNSTAVQNPEKITKIPSIKGDKLLKKSSTVQFVKRDKTPEQKSEETEISPQKRMTEEASDKKRDKSSRMSDDDSDDDFQNSSNSSNASFEQVEVVKDIQMGDNIPQFQSLTKKPVKQYVEPPTGSSSDIASSSTTEFKIGPTNKRFGFIGLGEMGQKIVRVLLNSGHDVSVWNRTPEKCKQFVDIGVKQFMTISELVLNCDFIFSCLSGSEASNSIFFGKKCILESLRLCKPESKGFIEMSTIDPNTSQKIAEAITQKGSKYLEAPINILKVNAEDPPLILAAGDHGLFTSCLSCFRAISKDSYYIGCDVGKSAKMNVLLSTLMCAMHAGMVEGLALTQKMNFSKELFTNLIAKSPRSCPLVADKSQSFIANNFCTESSLELQRKNLCMALELGNQYSQPLPLTAATNELLKEDYFLPFCISNNGED
ncbi:putative oxidoreductase GLYR1 homolog [Trichonephila inaurata madagascariensis]|uniref:Cytokine-like nuclear factor N-PAC n=1 Tax=Trichonephila inaurata madagascariensis TaxID=2747483 RepID=A0A8X6YN71_9ARAC|nr:putative oxidoreductase GLYR1 homolog [Trichonephila inaurata madagascariensis]